MFHNLAKNLEMENTDMPAQGEVDPAKECGEKHEKWENPEGSGEIPSMQDAGGKKETPDNYDWKEWDGPQDTGDVVEMQDAEISKVENGEKKLDSDLEKGNYGEMKTDQDLRGKGYQRISLEPVTSIDDPGHQGIDGVYCKEDGHPKYIVVDAKYGTAKLHETADGRQMSENWINQRLDEAVGKEKADEIRMEKLSNPDQVKELVSHIDSDGNVRYDRLDENGKVVEKDVELS